MKKIIIALLLVTVCACTSEKKEQPKVVEQVKEVKKEFVLKMSFKTNKEDSFKFMLNNIKKDEFQSKNIQIIEKVAPASNFEIITANFGENTSNLFIISFGNKEVKEIEIKSIDLSYGEKILHIQPKEFGSYFVLNKFVSLDTITNKFLTKKVDGNFNPVINLRRKILQPFFKN